MINEDRLRRVADEVTGVPGIEAVVLGGSRARGTHHAGSDVDLGLYYEAATLDVAALTRAARGVVGAPVQVAGPGGWGPWVDGGAWLEVDGTAVDLILRDVERVREQRDRAIRGEIGFHWQLGHPLGFLDVTYAAEIATCRPLADPRRLVPQLRAGLDPYPAPLRKALRENLSSAKFLMGGVAKATSRGDVGYVQLCCATALMWCALSWHGEADVWVTNEKGLIPAVAWLPLDTGGFAEKASAALAAIGADLSADGLAAAVRDVSALVSDTRETLAVSA
ncbi:nucleotidyltransferase domain-containing protein [Brachybacterium sp. GCM10030267]|uniref:nucleotidyltransferase domain-containing protein n=1 Tax=Brachybacterium sp. GCM10030267 TaxID=3273381 RepID=UPI00360FA091